MSRRRRTGSVKTGARAGRNVRLRRLARDISQAELTKDKGTTLQQVRLVRAFTRINDPDLRRSVVALVETLAARYAD